jgi:hypothetical protein
METPTYIIVKTKKPHVHPKWNWFGLVAKTFQIHPSSFDGTSLGLKVKNI